MTSYLNQGVKAKMCDRSRLHLSIVWDRNILLQELKSELACDSIRSAR